MVSGRGYRAVLTHPVAGRLAVADAVVLGDFPSRHGAPRTAGLLGRRTPLGLTALVGTRSRGGTVGVRAAPPGGV